MKNLFLISVLFAILIAIPAAYAENTASCTFGDESMSKDNIFEKDFAAMAFVEKHPNVTRTMPTDESGSLKNQLVLQAENDGIKETLELLFHTDTNGCYIPASYHYSYDDGIIDATVKNSVANFTEIMNLIKSDEKKIEDFYPRNCNPIKLDYVIDGESKPHFCKIDKHNSIVMSLQKHIGDTVEIHIPQKTMDALFYNCNTDDEFFILVNDEEVNFEADDIDGTITFTMTIPHGSSRVEMIKTSSPNVDGNESCINILGVDGKYLSPLLQTKIGIDPDKIKCNSRLEIVSKHDGSPACVTPETIPKLVERGWTTQTLVHDMIMKSLNKNLGPECTQNTMQDIMDGNPVDERCARFIDELASEKQLEMAQRGYSFDLENRVWIKQGYPDVMMSMAEYYQQSLENDSGKPKESEPKPLDIASIEEKYIHLNPADACATISLRLLSSD